MEVIDMAKVLPLIEQFNLLMGDIHSSYRYKMFSLKHHCYLLDEIAQVRQQLEAVGIIRHIDDFQRDW